MLASLLRPSKRRRAPDRSPFSSRYPDSTALDRESFAQNRHPAAYDDHDGSADEDDDEDNEDYDEEAIDDEEDEDGDAENLLPIFSAEHLGEHLAPV